MTFDHQSNLAGNQGVTVDPFPVHVEVHSGSHGGKWCSLLKREEWLLEIIGTVINQAVDRIARSEE